MVETVLVDVFGDTVNMRILGFFSENPFDDYTVSEIAGFSGVSRNSVYKYIDLFVEKGYLDKDARGARNVYRLNRANPVVRMMDDFIDTVGAGMTASGAVASDDEGPGPKMVVELGPPRVLSGTRQILVGVA